MKYRFLLSCLCGNVAGKWALLDNRTARNMTRSEHAALNRIGKEAVVNHHLQVPFQFLKNVPDLACGDPGTGAV